MPTESFEVGDVVQLKSGGPVMTVSKVEPPVVTCVWFPSLTDTATVEEKFDTGELLKKVVME